MEKEIIRKLRKYEDFLTYKGISLIDRSEYELTMSSQSRLMLSPAMNLIKQFKLLLRTRLSKNKIHKKDVLFLAYTHSHVNTLAPVIKKMKDNFLVVKRDGFTNNVAKKLKQNNISYNDIEVYLTKESSKNIRKARKSLKNKYRELLKTGEFDKQNLSYIFLIYLPEMIRYIEIINNMLSVEKPRLLVVMNEITNLGNIAVHIAKQKSIKTLCIQHGTVGDASDFTPVYVDKLAVWGDTPKQAFIKKGVPEDMITVTGAPQFDDLALRNIDLKEKELKKIGIKSDKKIIVLATQPVLGIEQITEALSKVVKTIPETQLVIKTHPSEYSTKKYLEMAKKQGLDDVIVTGKYLHPLLNRCDILVTSSSTVGMEAMILDKPVITVNFTDIPDLMPYAEEGAAIGVYKKEDLMKAVKSLFYDKKARDKLIKKGKEFIYKRCYKIDGKASQRVADFINNIIRD